MATVEQWIEGARLRTFPNAIAPVLVGAAAAAELGGFNLGESLLALLMSMSLIIGVNFANDYSDGIRGTDADRVGPLRLVGSGVARPRSVLTAAVIAFALAGISGLVLVAVTGRWWMLLVGIGSIAAAWFYTGGKRPYGYAGLGEIAVFVFFGLVAVLGTTYVQAGAISGLAVGCAVAVGAFSSAVLVANNLRDIPTDTEQGKRTLAVQLGDARTRQLYTALAAVPFLISVLLAFTLGWAWIGLAAALLIVPAWRRVHRGAQGLALIPVLRDTALAMLVWSAGTAIALALAPPS